jgi:hypothetical protein
VALGVIVENERKELAAPLRPPGGVTTGGYFKAKLEEQK